MHMLHRAPGRGVTIFSNRPTDAAPTQAGDALFLSDLLPAPRRSVDERIQAVTNKIICNGGVVFFAGLLTAEATSGQVSIEAGATAVVAIGAVAAAGTIEGGSRAAAFICRTSRHIGHSLLTAIHNAREPENAQYDAVMAPQAAESQPYLDIIQF